MAIKSLRFSNFKSFSDAAVELGPFNVIVGSNAAGKSNFVNVLRFLRDIATYELDNAVSLQGGVKYLRNIRLGGSRPLRIELVSRLREDVFLPTKHEGLEMMRMTSNETTHKLVLHFRQKGLKYEVAESLVAMRGEFTGFGASATDIRQGKSFGGGELRFQLLAGKPGFTFRPAGTSELSSESFFLPFVGNKPSDLGLVYAHVPFLHTSEVFRDIGLYDFDPKLPKRAAQITAKAELDDDGSNLALVLKSVTEDPEKNRLFSNLVQNLLPFIDTLGVVKFADKSMLFKVREKYFTSEFLPASLVSDGTITITALILALYFGNKSTVVLEEPERNIHPALIANVVEMMKDASRNRQIIVTTHNPEVVKHAGIENLLLVSRDTEGFSTIQRPADREDVRTFLANEIGVDELFAQNLLGV